MLTIKFDYSGKKNRVDKGRHGIWSTDLHTGEDIVEQHGQQLCEIRGYDRPLVRFEISLAEDGEVEGFAPNVGDLRVLTTS